ncbi:MAG: HpcH/HpaI aldolase family protein [Tumebacillaceae bacterium]
MKERLQAGEMLYGTWVRIPHPVVVEVLGRSGLDFLHIDMEHAAIGTGEIDRLLLAAKTTETPAIVRVPGLDEAMIGRALDLGAAGVIVPKINSGDDAKRAIQAARFHPLGLRGLGGACRADGYGSMSFEQFASTANRSTLLALQIETKQAVERIDEILEISGEAVDVFYIGPADLSQSLGVPGQFDDPLLRETIQWVVKRIQKKGKAVGIHVPSLEMVKSFTDLGIRYITCSFDLGLLSTGAKQLAQLLKP